MATYGLQYTKNVYNKALGECSVQIYKKNFVGDYSDLTIAKGGVRITVSAVDYFEPIVSTSLSLDIINNKTNFYELDDLFSISDLEYQVFVFTNSSPSVTLFRGFIPCEVVEQAWLPNGIITLNATNNLNRLNQSIPTILQTRGNYKLIDIISSCLDGTGLLLPIYINCSLKETMAYTGDTCFDQTTIDADVYYKDSTELQTSKYVLESILKTFGCFIYYYNDAWYIERLKDIGNATKAYKKYAVNRNTVTTVNVTLADLVLGTDIRPINTSQSIVYIPGCKKLKVTFNETQGNLLSYYFTNITKNYSNLELNEETITKKYWGANDEIDYTILPSNGFTPINIIYRGIKLHNTATSFSNQDYYYLWSTTGGGYPGTGGSPSEYRKSFCGLYSRIDFSFNTDSTVKLTLSLKLQLTGQTAHFFDYLPNFETMTSEHTFFLRFFLRYSVAGLNHFIVYDDTLKKYKTIQQDDILGYPDGEYYTLNPCIIQIPINFDSFESKDTYYHSMSVDIDLDSDVKDVIGQNTSLLFGLCGIGHNGLGTPYTTGSRIKYCNIVFKDVTYGDIAFTVNNSAIDNTYLGEIVSDFVNENTTELDIYDSYNSNVVNGMYSPQGVGPGYEFRHTNSWQDAVTADRGYPIVKHLIEDKFQIYNKVRRQINTDAYSLLYIKPYRIVSTTLLNKDFYVCGYEYVVDSDIYKDLTLKEYVSDDSIS